MVAGIHLTSILLVCLLSELGSSSAFPKARSVYPEAWQGVSEEQQDGRSYGNRRPLEYIRSLRQPQRNQPIAHDEVHPETWQMPQSRSLVSSQSLIENEPDQTFSQNRPWSAIATERLHKMSPTISPKHPLPMPRSFQFNINHPFDVFLQNKETGSTMKDFDLQSGQVDASTHSELPKRSRVQLGLALASVPAKPQHGQTQRRSEWISLNSGETVQEQATDLGSGLVDGTLFAFSSEPYQQTPAEHFSQYKIPTEQSQANLKPPGEADAVFFQNSYTVPAKPQPSQTQRKSEWISLNSGETVQEQATDMGSGLADGTPLAFSSGPYQQAPAQHFNQYKIPTEQRQTFPKQVKPIYSAQPIAHYPQQSDIFTAQINPTSNDYGEAQHGKMVYSNPTDGYLSSAQLQYESIPSGHYSADQVKPSGKYNGQHETWPLTRFTFPSEHHSQFEPFYGERHIVETVPPVQSFSQYDVPPFSYNREAAPNYATGNVALLGPKDYSSLWPYQYGTDQSGHYSLPPYDTTFYSQPNFQYLPVNYQTQMRFPEQDSDRRQQDRKPYYPKLFIDVEDEGQTKYYGGYWD